MKLSVIIPCYNAAATLPDQLEALSRQCWPHDWECIIADNGSTDGTGGVVGRYAGRIPGLRVVDASGRRGAAHARNVGVRHSSGASLAFCDADDLMEDGWVAAMGEALERHELVACRVDTARLNAPHLRGHDQEHGLQRIWYPPWLAHAGGGTLGCRRSLFDTLGGFDESMLYLEDTELCFQAQLRGVEMVFVADALMHIRRRPGVLGHLRQSMHYAEYNVILARKYWPGGEDSQGYRRKFLREIRELALGVKGLRHEQQRYAWAWQLGRQLGRLRGMVRGGGLPV